MRVNFRLCSSTLCLRHRVAARGREQLFDFRDRPREAAVRQLDRPNATIVTALRMRLENRLRFDIHRCRERCRRGVAALLYARRMQHGHACTPFYRVDRVPLGSGTFLLPTD